MSWTALQRLATSGGFSPFGAYGTTFPPAVRWDYGYFPISPMTQQAIVKQSSPFGVARELDS